MTTHESGLATATDHVLCDELGVTEDDAERWVRFLGLGAEDQEKIATINSVIAGNIDEIIDSFFAYIMQIEQLARFFADERTLTHMKMMQREYLLTLGQDASSLGYCETRLRVGKAHERAGLQQRWYYGSSLVLERTIGECLRVHFPDNDVGHSMLLAHLDVLNTLLVYDNQLVTDAYHHAATTRVEAILEQLNESQSALQQRASIDELTQVSNRRALLESLEVELIRSQRSHDKMSLLMIDIDHFKKVNDTHGHLCGDQVIKSVVGTIRGAVRPTDIVGRYGGEEFVVGLTSSGVLVASRMADRIRLQLALKPVRFEEKNLPVTISVGVSQLTPETENLDLMLKQADEALYHAKEGGRNRVSMVAEDGTPVACQ